MACPSWLTRSEPGGLHRMTPALFDLAQLKGAIAANPTTRPSGISIPRPLPSESAPLPMGTRARLVINGGAGRPSRSAERTHRTPHAPNPGDFAYGPRVSHTHAAVLISRRRVRSGTPREIRFCDNQIALRDKRLEWTVAGWRSPHHKVDRPPYTCDNYIACLGARIDR